jgi:hypothetical protein
MPRGQSEILGAAVVVFPGGGYQGLAIYFEATEVGDWLTPKGITFAAEIPRDGCGGVSEIGPYPYPYPESPVALELPGNRATHLFSFLYKRQNQATFTISL